MNIIYKDICLDIRLNEAGKISKLFLNKSKSELAVSNDRSKLEKYIFSCINTKNYISDEFLDLSGITEFQLKVYDALCDVPRGSVISYGDLASKIGFPSAARAVGQAMGKNPFPVVIPCHRVVSKDYSLLLGKIGGFSQGVDIKRKLLRYELI
jgi:O-6-methylguanine DNA methyltransferase